MCEGRRIWELSVPSSQPCCEPKTALKNSVFKKTKQNKTLQITNAGEGVEKREPSHTVGGNVNWYSHYGKQYGGSSEN